MKRRRSEAARRHAVRTALVCAIGAWAGLPAGALAQADEAGASFLLVPIGARFVALGGAGVADPTGRSALFGNPAAFARLTKPLAGLEYGLDDISSRLVVSGVVPSRVLGTVAVSAYVYNVGTQDLTGLDGEVTGSIAITNVVAAASYAARFGSRLVAGVNYKYVQYRFDCTGACSEDARRHPSTTALDVGAQYDVGRAVPVHLGASLRNVGLRLQVKDRAQSDPLPTQLVVGGAVDVAQLARRIPDATVRVLADATRPLGARFDATYHVGAEATYQKKISLRAGYAKRAGGYGGPTIGFGLLSQRFSLDLAQQLGASGLLADRAPTYVALNYTF